MRLAGRGIDEYTLAAYLAGRLSPSRRKDVADFLRSDEDAREILSAANQLLESEGDGQSSSRPPLTSVSLPPRRRPLLTQSARLGVILWTTVILVCLTAFLTTVVVAYRAGVDRGLTEVVGGSAETSRMITMSGPLGTLDWHDVGGASSYRLVIWDDETASVVGRVDSDVPSLDMTGIAGFLDESPHRIWFDAFDEEGRLLERSRSVLLRQ
ncbi:MAG: hypothetical protein HKN29_10070 [Rhodothermales bacterium]|nr:hypothetical protein [Rhodothermales bacterium]